MASTYQNLIDVGTRLKVSTTLDKSVGKKYLTDGNPETCWTSQQGLPQYIFIAFSSPVKPRTISVVFQGGFVGTRCSVEAQQETPDGPSKLEHLVDIYPEDVNRRQSFELPDTANSVHQLKLVFQESSDFFGRITIYDLQVQGLSVQ